MKGICLNDLTSTLPKHIGDKYEGSVDWDKSIGHNIHFIYETIGKTIIEGDIKIKGWEDKTKRMLLIEYEEEIKSIYTQHLKGGHIGGIIDKHIYKVGQVIKDDKRDLTITKIEDKKGVTKGYWYKCNIVGCGHESWINEANLSRGVGCGGCSGQVVTESNSLYGKEKDLVIRYKIDIEIAKNVTCGSNKIIKPTCPYCDKKVSISVREFLKRGINCCKDNISYGEKFIKYFLDILKIEYVMQYNPKWKGLGKRRYDFYLPKYNIIIEVHGRQHYEKCYYWYKKKGGRTLVEEQQNDKEKKEIALINGIDEKFYITLDCRRSELEWIKNSIADSLLVELLGLNLNEIDFKEIHKKTFSSIKNMAIKMYNEGLSVKEITYKLGISKATIPKWLNDGTKNGLCNYNGKEEQKKSMSQYKGVNHSSSKKIVLVDKNGNCDINKVMSAGEWANELGISRNTVSNLLNTNKGYNPRNKKKRYLRGIKLFELDVYLQLQ